MQTKWMIFSLKTKKIFCFSFDKEKLEVAIKQSFFKIKEAATKTLEVKVCFCKKEIKKKNEKKQGATSELVRYI